jgi:hypothetical protein
VKVVSKEFLFSVYTVNLDMDLAISMDIRSLSLIIMPNPKKYGFGKYSISKIFGFNYHVRLKKI